jgi:hypothetical protein
VDVTGRSETDPAAETLTRNILQHVSDWKPAPVRTAVYIGDPAGKRHLESAGFVAGNYDGGKLPSGQVLIVGPNGGRELAADKTLIADWLEGGGNLLALGLDQQNADAVLPLPITFGKAEHISAFFEPNGANSPFRGIGPADLHNRDPRELNLITSGTKAIGNGVLATTANSKIVFCQLIPWQFDPTRPANLKRTYRRASFVVTRLLANAGVAGTSPILARFNTPVDTEKSEKRWLDGLYLDQPEEWDDPYRFFRW